MEPAKYLEVLHLAEKLKDTTRHCYTSGGRHESVAEHSWRMTLMAYWVSDEFPEADLLKILKMCLIHDLGEIFTGDIPVSRKTAADEAREEALLMDWVDSLPSPFREEMRALYEEMIVRETLEARIYKAMDSLEAVIQHNESDLSTWEPHEYELNRHYAEDRVAFSPYLTELRRLIREETEERIRDHESGAAPEKKKKKGTGIMNSDPAIRKAPSREEAAQARYRDLTETPVSKLIPRLAIPTVISMLVTALYNAADTFFVGRISTSATAAVGLAFSVMSIIQAFGFFCGQGSGNFMSRRLGAGKTREAEEMAATGLALSFIIGLALTALIIAFARPLAVFLGASPSTERHTVRYLRIIAVGAPFMTGQFVLNNQLRYQGSAVYAMAGLLTGAVLNIGLDPLLIFVFRLEVGGAALATIAGQIISFFVLLAGTRKGGNIRLQVKNVRLNAYYLLEIVNGGIPALFRQGLTSVATILLNRAAGVYGDAAIAGMSVTTRTIMFVYSALIGFGQGYQPVCAFNYGAGRKERVREGFFFCVRYGTVFLTLMSVLCLLFAPAIIGFFRDDPAVIEVGAAALRWQAAALPLQATVVLTNMMLQATGKGLKASVTASARSGIFFIPLILILPPLLGLTGVEMTQACADALAFLLAVPLAASELKKMKADS